MSIVGLVYDERMALHDPLDDTFPERPERILHAWSKIEESGLLQQCVRVPCVRVDARVIDLTHDTQYLYGLLGHETELDDDNDLYWNEHTAEAAFLAAGGVVELVKCVLAGDIDCGFALIRPPGHHAKYGQGGGFCHLNNVMVGVNYARTFGDLKILIFDFDVHHGDGTEQLVQGLDNVLFVSMHRHGKGFYPGTGKRTQGNCINIPLKQGAGDAKYRAMFANLALPKIQEFEPDLVFVSCGFDCLQNDPLGCMELTVNGVRYLMEQIKSVCDKMVCVLEGGYDLDNVANGVIACLEVLNGS